MSRGEGRFYSTADVAAANPMGLFGMKIMVGKEN